MQDLLDLAHVFSSAALADAGAGADSQQSQGAGGVTPVLLLALLMQSWDGAGASAALPLLCTLPAETVRMTIGFHHVCLTVLCWQAVEHALRGLPAALVSNLAHWLPAKVCFGEAQCCSVAVADACVCRVLQADAAVDRLLSLLSLWERSGALASGSQAAALSTASLSGLVLPALWALRHHAAVQSHAGNHAAIVRLTCSS